MRERRTAATDPLTGLLNRRGFGDLLEGELERSGADRSPLSLLVLDCDEFKAVNDRGGHERGDRVLLELADLIRTGLGPGEAASRLGGDEFALTLPRTDADAALARADALRMTLAAGLSEAGTPLRVSIGVATYPFDGATGTQLLRAADQGLYAAKASGKDLVVAFRDLGDWARRGDAARARERRARLRPVVAPDAAAQIAAVRGESAPEQVLLVLSRALTGSLSATATVTSRVLGGTHLLDVARYALRDIDLGSDAAYLLDDFPLTKRVLVRREPIAMSFLDASIDRAEAFILRELGMNSLLMLPIVVGGEAWGLVEVYDVRLREFEGGDIETARALVTAAARRLEELGAEGADLDAVGRRGDAPIQRPIRGEAPAVERSLRTGESLLGGCLPHVRDDGGIRGADGEATTEEVAWTFRAHACWRRGSGRGSGSEARSSSPDRRSHTTGCVPATVASSRTSRTPARSSCSGTAGSRRRSTPARRRSGSALPESRRLGGFGGTSLVGGVRWSGRGKDAGSIHMQTYGRD